VFYNRYRVSVFQMNITGVGFEKNENIFKTTCVRLFATVKIPEKKT
jgi:hypothetical protein